MIEVFKTNIRNVTQARKLIRDIRRVFAAYEANVDLDDCDRILRIETWHENIEINCLIDLLQTHGVVAVVLEDVVPS